jgi:hypothetical protein
MSDLRPGGRQSETYLRIMRVSPPARGHCANKCASNKGRGFSLGPRAFLFVLFVFGVGLHYGQSAERSSSKWLT